MRGSVTAKNSVRQMKQCKSDCFQHILWKQNLLYFACFISQSGSQTCIINAALVSFSLSCLIIEAEYHSSLVHNLFLLFWAFSVLVYYWIQKHFPLHPIKSYKISRLQFNWANKNKFSFGQKQNLLLRWFFVIIRFLYF